MRILITGGTGALAREIVSVAEGRDVALRLTNRRAPKTALSAVEWVGADLATGDGLRDALSDIDVVIHTASDFKRAAVVDVDGTRRLMNVAKQVGVCHVVYVSIVGIDFIPYPYYEAKLAAEAIIAKSGVPYSILRATQFHTLIDARLSGLAGFPMVMPVPRAFQFQTVDTREVAVRLLDIALLAPQERLLYFGGPEIMRLGDMAASWRQATSISKPVLPVILPGKVASAFRAGKNTAPTGMRGSITWREWLAQRYRSGQP